jgi:hypothetical protein
MHFELTDLELKLHLVLLNETLKNMRTRSGVAKNI